MGAKFKAGQKVRQKMPKPKEGTVSKFVLDEKSGDIHVHVNVDGHDHSFHEDQLEAVEPAPSEVPTQGTTEAA